MIANPSFHLNKFIKGATGCGCPGDGVFFIKITSGKPILSNIEGDDLGFLPNKFLTRWLKQQGKTYTDGVYGFRLNDGYVAMESLGDCPQTFVANDFLTEFVFNTADCEQLSDGFYGIRVLGCDATYLKILDDGNCGLTAVTGLSSNSYTCGDVLLSRSAVEGASSYTITYGETSVTTTDLDELIPYTSSGTVVYSIVANGIVGSGPATTISVAMIQCAILGLTDNNYIHGDLILSWDENEDATYYTITYGATTTTVTDPTITITFTSGGPVTYQVSACDGSGCSVPSSVTVNMMQSNVTGINNGTYTCGDMTISWDAVTGASGYLVTYPGNTVTTTSTFIVIPFTTSGSVTYTIQAQNTLGYNTGSSSSFTSTSCGITGLTYGSYTCGDVTLDWNDVATATSYRISYGGTVTTVTSSTVVIPFDTNGTVTYTIEAFNGLTLLTTATIDVPMTTCNTYNGNAYFQYSLGMGIITNNNPTNPIGDNTIIDTFGSGEITGFAGAMTANWVEQDYHSKKVFYGTPSGLYVGLAGYKTVTQLASGSGWTIPAFVGSVVWYYNSSTGALYKGSTTSIGTLMATHTGYTGIVSYKRASGGYVYLWKSDFIWLLDSFGGLSSGYSVSGVYIRPTFVSPDDYDPLIYQGKLCVYSNHTGSYNIHIYGSGRAVSLDYGFSAGTGCGSPSVNQLTQLEGYGDKLYYTYSVSGGESQIVPSGSYYVPQANQACGVITTTRTSPGSFEFYFGVNNFTDVNNTRQGYVYQEPYVFGGNFRYYLSRVLKWSLHQIPTGYAYLMGIGSFSLEGSGSTMGATGGIYVKVNANGVYAGERSRLPTSYASDMCSGVTTTISEVFRL